jgi:hypothetical protein
MSALRDRIGALTSLYLLVPVPLVTDLIENGELPVSPLGRLTECSAPSSSASWSGAFAATTVRSSISRASTD